MMELQIMQKNINKILQLEYQMCNKSDKIYITNVIAMLDMMVIPSSSKII